MNPTDRDPMPRVEFMSFCCGYYVLHRGFPKEIRYTLGENILEEITEAKRLVQSLAGTPISDVEQCRKVKAHAQQFVTHLDNLRDVLLQAWALRLISHADMAELDLRLTSMAKKTQYWRHPIEC